MEVEGAGESYLPRTDIDGISGCRKTRGQKIMKFGFSRGPFIKF